MKKSIVTFFITLAFSSLGIFAQTEQQLTAESERQCRARQNFGERFGGKSGGASVGYHAN